LVVLVVLVATVANVAAVLVEAEVTLAEDSQPFVAVVYAVERGVSRGDPSCSCSCSFSLALSSAA
jgi:hypothetical protein